MKRISAYFLMLPLLALVLSNCGNQNSPISYSGSDVKVTPVAGVIIPGSVSQSSTYGNGSATRAIDGNTDGNYDHESVTHTKDDYQSWWAKQFSFWYTIDSVIIWNRTDCCAERLSNFTIQVSMDYGANWNDEWTLAGQCPAKCKFSYSSSKSWYNSYVKPVGNMFRIKLNTKNYLSLAEVVICGQQSTRHGARSITGLWPEMLSITRNGTIFSQYCTSWPWYTYPTPVDYSSYPVAIALTSGMEPKLWKLDAPMLNGGYTLWSRPYPGSGSWTSYPFSVGFKKLKTPLDNDRPYLMDTYNRVYRYTPGWGFEQKFSSAVQDFDVWRDVIYYLAPPSSGGLYTVYSQPVNGGSYTKYGTAPVAQRICVDANSRIFIANSASSNPIYVWKNGTWAPWGPALSGKVYSMHCLSYSDMFILTDPAYDGGYTIKATELSGGTSWKDLPMAWY